MPQPRSSSSTAKKPPAAKKPAAKKPAAKRPSTAKATASRTTASRAKDTPRKAAPRKTAPKAAPPKGDDDRLAQLRDLLSQAVVLPTERVQAVLDDARRRGHIDTKGVGAIRDGLLKQAEDARGTLETLLRSSAGAVVEAVRARVPGGGGDKGGTKGGAKTSATPDPTKLKANEITSKLDTLTAAQLKKVRKQEADGPNRKSVLSAIDKRLK